MENDADDCQHELEKVFVRVNRLQQSLYRFKRHVQSCKEQQRSIGKGGNNFHSTKTKGVGISGLLLRNALHQECDTQVDAHVQRPKGNCEQGMALYNQPPGKLNEGIEAQNERRNEEIASILISLQQAL